MRNRLVCVVNSAPGATSNLTGKAADPIQDYATPILNFFVSGNLLTTRLSFTG